MELIVIQRHFHQQFYALIRRLIDQIRSMKYNSSKKCVLFKAAALKSGFCCLKYKRVLASFSDMNWKLPSNNGGWRTTLIRKNMWTKYERSITVQNFNFDKAHFLVDVFLVITHTMAKSFIYFYSIELARTFIYLLRQPLPFCIKVERSLR